MKDPDASLASNPDAITIKLADRIANIEHGGKIDMYAKEHKTFKHILFIRGHDTLEMWDHLEQLLKEK